MSDIGSSMGIGGSGGVFGRKTELVADLTSAFKTLNAELVKTRDLSAQIAKNLKGAFPGGGGSNDVGLDLATTSQNTQPNMGSGGAQTNFLGKLVKVGAAVGMAAYGGASALMSMGPSAADSVDAQVGAGQLRGFTDTKNQNRIVPSLLNTANSGSFLGTNDVLNAAMSGQMYVMGVGNKAAMSSYAMLSNINPGMSGQQAAGVVANINSAQNVNAARMIGINIRDNKGGMRSIQDIVNDIWTYLNRNKRTSGPITKLEIDNSLQPGNALDSILNTYFGGSDSNTRESIIKLLYMKAGGNALDKAGAQKAGFLAGVTAAGGTAATSKATNALGKYGAAQTAGITDFEKEVSAANKALEVLSKSPIFDKAVEIKTLMDQNTNALNALTGVVTGLLASLGGGLLKDLLGKGSGLIGGAKNMFSKGKGLLSKGFNFLKGAGSKALKFGKSALHDAGSFAKTAYGDIEPIMGEVEAVGEFAGEEALGAGADVLTGGAATGLDLALQGVMMKQLYDAFHKKKGKGGSDNTLFGYGGPGDGDSDMTGSALSGAASNHKENPVAGNAPITSKFGEVRYLRTNMGRNASYGKPHGGVDFGIGTGTPLRAVKDGKVIPTPFDSGGFGNYVLLDTGDGYQSYYGHLSNKTASGSVKAGDIIGYSGNSGNSTGPHLHYEVRKGQTKVDPMSYLHGAASDSTNPGINKANPTSMIYGGEGSVPAATYGVSGKGDGASDQVVNYGGVTIQVNVPNNTHVDHKKLIEDIKAALKSDNIRHHAMGR